MKMTRYRCYSLQSVVFFEVHKLHLPIAIV